MRVREDFLDLMDIRLFHKNPTLFPGQVEQAKRQTWSSSHLSSPAGVSCHSLRFPQGAKPFAYGRPALLLAGECADGRLKNIRGFLRTTRKGQVDGCDRLKTTCKVITPTMNGYRNGHFVSRGELIREQLFTFVVHV